MRPLDLEEIDAADIVEGNPPGMRLPAFLRAKGVLPVGDDLRPGDIILYAPRRAAWHQRRIISVQSQSYDQTTAGYTHAAIYLGDFQICEALWRGVVVSSFLDGLNDYRVLVRRFPGVGFDVGFRVAIRCLQRLTSAYSPRLLWRVFWHALRGLHRERLGGLSNRLAGGPATICSVLCAEAVAEATKSLIVPLQSGTAMPADLAATASLTTVRVRWQRLP